MVNSIDPDQMPLFVESDLGLHCLQRPKYLWLLQYIIKTEVTPIYISRLFFTALCADSADDKLIFFFLSRKQDLFHANCLQ